MSEEKEVSFLKKLIISIKNFEKYPELASKKWGVVLSYFVKLLAIFTVVAAFASTYMLVKKIEATTNYIKEEIPNFTFENNTLEIEQSNSIIKEDKNTFFDKIIIDTMQNEEKLEQEKEELNQSQNGILFGKDKLFLKTQIATGITEYSYSSISEAYKIQNFNKQEMLQYFSGTNLILIEIGIFILLYIYLLFVYFISVWLDVILLATFGFLSALFMRIHLRFSAMCKMAIHSLTLPILLNAIVVLIETFTSFRIQYFDVMYIGVSYIYMVTAILMIKSDVIKNQKELAKIIEEQQKVKQEMERKKEEEEKQKEEQRREKEKEEKRKKEKKEEEEEKNVGEQPQGENA